ncbi:NAD(P)H-dependent oxidoreductase [Pseudoflavonifractor sp. DSM 107456]|uniref:NAD(P)H-dependent oxidoreductase n=1 Tax=Pseudoflavonifractor gallinarum TaxID=2779352 RepID=A0ABR9RCD4_9FIRM|nr:NAD(P)H-dependent oxidoreductase [Pseudoflavonifractor gallinarum]
MRTLVEQLDRADGILVASPVYCMGPTPQLSAFCSRLRAIRDCFRGCCGANSWRPWRWAAPATAGRRLRWLPSTISSASGA